MNLSEASVPYRAYLEGERLLKPDTVRAYILDIRDLVRVVGDVSVATIGRGELRKYMRWMTDMGRARATIQRRMWGFGTFFKWACYDGLRTDDPTDGLVLPRKKVVERAYLSEDEFRVFTETAPPNYPFAMHERDRAAWRLMAFCGLRRGELLGLRVEDIRLDDRLLIIRDTKDGNDHTVYMPVDVVEDVRAAMSNRSSGYLLTGWEGGRWNGQSLSVSFRYHLQACGLDGRGYTPHTIRHTFGTHLSRAGVKIEDVSKLMRHKEVKTTMRYIHHDADGLRDALSKHPLLDKPT